MKLDFTHNNKIFGDSAEEYLSQLFNMMINLNGTNRPDLVSYGKTFHPPLTMEIKSGKEKKGIITEYQLHYAMTSAVDYKELFEEHPIPPRNGLFTQKQLGKSDPFLNSGKIAYYYNIIHRTDNLEKKDMDPPFASIKIKWGDQYIVPHEFVFHTFAVAKHLRTGIDLTTIVTGLKETMKEQSLAKYGYDHDPREFYKRRKTQSWQTLRGKDILSIFHKDFSYTTKQGKKRIELLRKQFPKLDQLKRTKISGPNETSIYVLSKPEDHPLWNIQVRKIIQERVPIMEKVIQEREKAKPLLKKIIPIFEMDLFDSNTGEIEEINQYEKLTFKEIKKLERLVKWESKKEKDTEIPF